MSRLPIDRIPERVKPAAYRLRSWMLTDKPIYLVCAATAFAYALANYGFFGMQTTRVHPLPAVTPREFWATVWLIVAAALCASAVWEKYRLTTVSLSSWSAMMMLWGISYWSTWALGEWSRGPAVGVVHIVCPLVVSLAVWRGSRAEFMIIKEV